MSKKRTFYLWVDIETSGLDLHRGTILEVAAKLFSDSPLGNGKEEWSWSSPIKTLKEDLWDMDDFVRDMHIRNGLLSEAMESTSTLQDFFVCLDSQLDSLAPRSERSVILAGNSVHFDRDWLYAHCPPIKGLFHYRLLDISAINILLRDLGIDPYDGLEKPENHRALSDIQASINTYRNIRRQLGAYTSST